MAVDNFSSPPLRHIAKVTSSGTFVVPNNISRVFVVIVGSRGGTGTQNSQPGAAGRGAGWVEVLPGSTCQVVIGAGGTSNAVPNPSGNSGGTTLFDGSVVVTGASGGQYDNRYGAHNSQAGSASFDTSLPGGAPSGAIARVSGTASSTDSNSVGGSGFVHIFA